MKRINKAILDHLNEDELIDYINSLEEEIEETTEAERKLDKVLDNVLEKYQYFNDVRHLRASNIMAINQLLKTKKELRDTRISNKKDLLSLIMRKRSDDSKNKALLEVGDKDQPQVLDFKTLLIQLDNFNVHPIVDKEMLEKSEMLIDANNEEFKELPEGGK